MLRLLRPFPCAALVGAALLAAASPLSAQIVARPGAGPGARVDPRVDALLEDISPERLSTYLNRLVGFETRHLMSLRTPREGWGIGPAREYILETMRSFSPRLQVALDCYDVAAQDRIPEPVELCNVVAVLPGRSPRRVYVSGHYDTVARQEDGTFDYARWQNPAPGANDDGSGTVLTMELARVFAQSGLDFDATLVFVALAGEEEGLVGATLHAREAEREGVVIDAVFNNDIVGNSAGGNGRLDSRTVRVFSEDPTDSPSRQLARYIRRWAGLYVPDHEVRLIAREDRFGRGGDHTAFNQSGYAAVRFTESRENYARQHDAGDVLSGVDFAYLARNARVNAAPLATLALAPPAPGIDEGRGPTLGRGASGYAAHLRWRRAPGAVGYRIVWRSAWTRDWEHERYVDDVEELVIPDLSIDDFTFGVAAVGPGGHESLVSAYVRPPRAHMEVRRGG